ncbi:uncharacterized protein ZBIST_5147 [Zygosaccharomyces bailii]|nr:uncharacterized protein ZBIST_5147 [Zygosaccharomyces bailii]
MSDQKTKDLENCAEIYGEEEIQLLEDRRAGNLMYFISWYFFGGKWLWNIFLPFCWVIVAIFMCLSYLSLRDIYYYRLDDTKTSELFPPLWLAIHYFLALVVLFVGFIGERKNLILEEKTLEKLLEEVSETDLMGDPVAWRKIAILFLGFIGERKNLILEEKTLEKLLEEVSETDLMGDPVAWRRIAFNVNQCFVKKKYNSSIFYGGEKCRCYFVKEVVIPLNSGSFAIRTSYNEYIYTDFCKNASKKKLAQKAVANYNKSIENYDDLSYMDGKFECDKVFEKFHIISMASILLLFSIEIAFSAIMSLAMVALVIYHAIFN